MSDCESGKCDCCGKHSILERRYFYYNVECDCCRGDKHFVIVRHCSDCEPKAPLKVNLIQEIEACERGEVTNKIAEAMEVIKQAMIDDNPSEPGSYAHSWHCNIAMMCHDAMRGFGGVFELECNQEAVHQIANDAASRFMKLCFDVETKG